MSKDCVALKTGIVQCCATRIKVQLMLTADDFAFVDQNQDGALHDRQDYIDYVGSTIINKYILCWRTTALCGMFLSRQIAKYNFASFEK